MIQAIALAKEVLHIFEEKYPNDPRPRNAIKAAEDYLDGRITRRQFEAIQTQAIRAMEGASDYSQPDSSGYANSRLVDTPASRAAYCAVRACGSVLSETMRSHYYDTTRQNQRLGRPTNPRVQSVRVGSSG